MLIEHEGPTPQVDPGAPRAEVRRGYAELFGRHRDDRVMD